MRITINTSKGLWVKTLESLGLMEVASEQPTQPVSEPTEPFVQPVQDIPGGLTLPDAEVGFPFQELSESAEIAAREGLLEEVAAPPQNGPGAEVLVEDSLDFGELERSEVPEVSSPHRNGREKEPSPTAGGSSRPAAQAPSPISRVSGATAFGSPTVNGPILKGKDAAPNWIQFRRCERRCGLSLNGMGPRSCCPRPWRTCSREIGQGNGASPIDSPEPLWMALRDSDLVLMNTPSEWELMEPIRPGFLSQYAKPAILTGSKNLLLRVAQLEQAGRRDYIVAPAAMEELVWRASLMLGRPAPSRAELPVSRPQRAKPEILIVDEDASARSLISTMLERYGMVCIQAEQGREALDLIRTSPPDAVVSEVLALRYRWIPVAGVRKAGPRAWSMCASCC